MNQPLISAVVLCLTGANRPFKHTGKASHLTSPGSGVCNEAPQKSHDGQGSTSGNMSCEAACINTYAHCCHNILMRHLPTCQWTAMYTLLPVLMADIPHIGDSQKSRNIFPLPQECQSASMKCNACINQQCRLCLQTWC